MIGNRVSIKVEPRKELRPPFVFSIYFGSTAGPTDALTLDPQKEDPHGWIELFNVGFIFYLGHIPLQVSLMHPRRK